MPNVSQPDNLHLKRLIMRHRHRAAHMLIAVSICGLILAGFEGGWLRSYKQRGCIADSGVMKDAFNVPIDYAAGCKNESLSVCNPILVRDYVFSAGQNEIPIAMRDSAFGDLATFFNHQLDLRLITPGSWKSDRLNDELGIDCGAPTQSFAKDNAGVSHSLQHCHSSVLPNSVLVGQRTLLPPRLPRVSGNPELAGSRS